jgi:hypothetical protein
MTNQHPITPPPELVQPVAPTDDDLRGIFSRFCDNGDNGPPWIESEEFIQAARAVLARWGADQELEACVNWLIENQNPRWAHVLHSARRPTPPSLKEQALDELTSAERLYPADWSTIRRALEALPND